MRGVGEDPLRCGFVQRGKITVLTDRVEEPANAERRNEHDPQGHYHCDPANFWPVHDPGDLR